MSFAGRLGSAGGVCVAFHGRGDRGQGLHHLVEVGGVGLHAVGADGVARRDGLVDSVHVGAVLDQFEVEVGPGGKARGSNIADYLALAHMRTLLDAFAEGAHVKVLGGVCAVVLDLDKVAVAAIVLGAEHGAVADGPDGGACGGGVVGAEVGTATLEDGVETLLVEV